MTHKQAVARDCVDKYLLGQLLKRDEAKFEKHYFGCPECAKELERTAIFVANVRAALAEKQRAAGKKRTAGKKRKPRQT